MSKFIKASSPMRVLSGETFKFQFRDWTITGWSPPIGPIQRVDRARVLAVIKHPGLMFGPLCFTQGFTFCIIPVALSKQSPCITHHCCITRRSAGSFGWSMYAWLNRQHLCIQHLAVFRNQCLWLSPPPSLGICKTIDIQNERNRLCSRAPVTS